jgi:hypothetical protein
LHILHRAIAGDALYDSAARYPQPRCHPDTRTKLLEVLWNWARGIEPPGNWSANDFAWRSDDSPEANGPSSGILWLHGPAGAGKSAVAQSFCQKLAEEGPLGGSFFFKRGDLSRGNANKLFTTIAYQLALLPQLKELISQAVENDPSTVDRSISNQLQKLIVEPCRKASLHHPVPIIIDGLDECEGPDVQQQVLRSIGSVICQGNLPVLFLICSRPESHIRESFASLDGIHWPLNIEQSFHDVRTYLLDEFARIHQEHETMTAVAFGWPESKIVEDLVKRSSGYFIYASTVIKFVDDKRFRPVDRLNVILGLKSSPSGSPFEILDQVYRQILACVPVDFLPQLLGIMQILVAQSHLSFRWPIPCIEQLLELETGDLHLTLRDLHSVIGINSEECIYAHHASFVEFANNPSRSGPFCAGSGQCRTMLASRILRAFAYHDDDPLLTARHFAW